MNLVLAVLLLLTGTMTSQKKEESNLSVLTYNIHSCVGSDGKYSVERVADVLEQADADVVCLQEVEVNFAPQATRTWSAEHHDDQPALIAQKAGYPHYEFAKAITSLADKRTNRESFVGDGKGDFGVAILSKWPIQEQKVLQYAPYREKTPRNVLACKIAAPAGNVWVLCTHLGCHYYGGEQLQQTKELRVFIESLLPDAPLVLGGDLNCPQWFAAVRELNKILKSSGTSILSRGTFPATGLFRGLIRLDYIFYSSNMTCTATTVHYDGAVASDHLPFSVSCERIP